MAPNKRKMLEAARKYAGKGAQERALKEYEALLKLDPRDAKLRLEVADAHRRWGQIEEASAAYRRVAEQYTAEGFDARAVAVYKQIQTLDPMGYAACEPLAELYQRMGLASEAISALQAAADGHARDGNKRHALDLLRRMVGLDPANTTSRIKVADLLRQEKLLDEAAAEYEAACDELERQGETEAAGRVIERMLELAPDRTDVLARFARNLLARGRADEAEAPARRAAEREAQEIGHHELLAEVYRAQRRDEKLVDVYRKIAELYRLRGDEEQARDIMQRFVPMQAFEAPLRTEEEAPFGDEPLEFDDPVPGPDLLANEEFLEDEGPVTRRAVAPRAEPASVRPPPPAVAPAAEETVFELGAEEGSRILGDPDALLAEASVYLRYGKRGQAIENLQAILARDPQHRGALEKLGDAYADDGDTGGAVAAWLRAGELARDAGDTDAMSVLRDRVAALDAGAAATLEIEDADADDDADAEELDLPDEPAFDAAPSARDEVSPEPIPDIEIDLEGFLDDGNADPAASVAPSATEPERGAETDSDGSLEIELDLDETDADAAELTDPGALELTDPDAAELTDPDALELTSPDAADLTSPDALELTDPDAAGLTDPDAAELTEPELPAADPAAAEVAPDAGSISSPERVAEDLEEAEFYLQQGLADEARALFERVLAASPGHPLALVRLGELAAAAGEDPDAPGADAAPLDGSLTPVAPPSARATAEETDPIAGEGWPEGADAADSDAPRDPDGGTGDAARDASAGAAHAGDFDLAAELSAALDAAVPEGERAGAAGDEGFQAVFGAFKRGVEATLGSGDHEAHYDLGIAYREMGLLDDAIAEFRSAMQSATRRIDCLHMLGLCALEQGRSEEAVDLLAHALGAPDVAQEQELAIRFELGRAYEQCGDLEKARNAWEKVAAVDPDFCEVSELLAGLSQPAAPAAGVGPATGPSAEPGAGAAPEAASDCESFDDLIEEAARAELEESGRTRDGDGRGAEERTGPRPKPRRRKISFV